MKYDSLAKRQAPAGTRLFLADIVNEDLALQNPPFNDLIWLSSINPPSELVALSRPSHMVQITDRKEYDRSIAGFVHFSCL